MGVEVVGLAENKANSALLELNLGLRLAKLSIVDMSMKHNIKLVTKNFWQYFFGPPLPVSYRADLINHFLCEIY